jgi:hypothetical protein
MTSWLTKEEVNFGEMGRIGRRVSLIGVSERPIRRLPRKNRS